MMFGIVKSSRPILDRRPARLEAARRVSPAEAAPANQPRQDEFLPSSTQPDADFVELYFGAGGGKNLKKPR